MRRVNKPMPTTEEIQALPPGRLYLGGGLLLKTTPTGYRCWMFRYKSPITGRFTETSIGPWPECDPSYTRQSAAQLLIMVLKGDDPVQVARQKETSKITFAEACEGFINKHKSKWRNGRHLKILIKHSQPFANMPVQAIDTPLVVKALSKLWEEHPEQGYRTSAVWARIFDFAKTMGYRTADSPNPAAWRGHLEHIFHRPKNHDKHHASLPYKDVPELFYRLRLREVKGTSPIALQFQILTATRPGETLGMRWSEIDLVNGIWTLPKERTKQNRKHRVPLSKECIRILSVQNEYRRKGQPFSLLSDDFVFQGYKGEALDDKSLRELLKRMDLPVHVTPHGFRSSFRNWAARARISTIHGTAERIDRDLAEMCLGHLVKGRVEAAYWTEDALDERRPIMDAWASYCG